MNWVAIGTCIALGIPLMTFYSKLLNKLIKHEDRISGLEDDQRERAKSDKEFQDKILQSIQLIEKTLVRLEARESQYTDAPACVLNHRRCDDRLQEARDAIAKDIEALELRLTSRINRLEDKK
jgi:hypothetical protein